MDEKQGLNVVIGASGAAGSVVTRELARRGRRVRAVNRSKTAVFPKGVEVFPADVQDAIAVREACRGASIVYNCVGAPYNRWPELLPLFTNNIIINLKPRLSWTAANSTMPLVLLSLHRTGKLFARRWRGTIALVSPNNPAVFQV